MEERVITIDILSLFVALILMLTYNDQAGKYRI